MRQLLDEARELERHLEDTVVSGTTPRFDRAQRRVRQLQMALDSDLFDHFEEEPVYRLRELAASIRVRHALVKRQLDEAHRLADECDELATVCEAADELGDHESKEKASERLDDSVQQLRDIHARSMVVYESIKQLEDDQQTIFNRMHR